MVYSVCGSSGDRITEKRKEQRLWVLILQLTDRQVQEKAQLQKNYYLKLKKSLNDETIFNYFGAERSFRKELIKDWPGNRRMPGRQ